MDPRLQQANQGKKQKQHQTEVTWAEAALLSWGVISCVHLGPHSESCVPRSPLPAHPPPACLDHPAAWEVRSRRLSWRLGLPLSAVVQASVLQLLRPASLQSSSRGWVKWWRWGGLMSLPRQFEHPETPPHSQTPGQGCSRPTFSFLLWWKKWEKVREKFQRRRLT